MFSEAVVGEGFMVDDKDDSATDPWAGIDDEGPGQAADGFEFSFDAVGGAEEQPDLTFAEVPAEVDGSTPEADNAPIIRIDASFDETPERGAQPEDEAETEADIQADADPFASLSIDGASTAADDASAGDVDAATDDISAWLEEPDPSAEGTPPLAVFAPQDGEITDEPGLPSEAISDGSAFAGIPAFNDVASDDLHEIPEGATATPAGSSHVEVGTGFSGIVSPSQIDPPSDIVAADDWPSAAANETSFDDFATDDQPSFDASGFDGVGEASMSVDVPSGLEGQEMEAAGAVAASAAVAAVKPAPAKAAGRKKGGGIGQLVGVVLGGLMAIPITYAILIWGFQKDPFKLAGAVPDQVAFLLPQKFQPGFKKQGLPKLDAAPALDDVPVVAQVTESAEPAPGDEPAVGSDDATPAGDAPADGVVATPEPPAKPDDASTEPQEPQPATAAPMPADELVGAAKEPPEPVAPPEPEPLDLAALEAAIGDATAAFETLALVDPEAADRKKLLVGWYKRLAAVAEQLVFLEKVAADSGRSLDEASAAIDTLCGTIAADEAVQADLAKLSGMWLSSRKRPADGAVLLATFDATRQVGPYWSTRVTIDGAEPRSVAVISRIEPRAEPGDRVLVTGVLFDGDVVWAADCRGLIPKTAPAEDLF